MQLTQKQFISQLSTIHRARLTDYLNNEVPAPEPLTLISAVETNHYHNCRLWREEDLARRTDVPAEEIVTNKRAIDRHNQLRNDATERIDDLLLQSLPVSKPGARLNSETPGAMVDRLSILSLKLFHMGLQLQRLDASAEHRRQCSEKLERLQAQHRDLSHCLELLLDECQHGAAQFRLYRQFKMYNDPRYRCAG